MMKYNAIHRLLFYFKFRTHRALWRGRAFTPQHWRYVNSYCTCWNFRWLLISVSAALLLQTKYVYINKSDVHKYICKIFLFFQQQNKNNNLNFLRYNLEYSRINFNITNKFGILFIHLQNNRWIYRMVNRPYQKFWSIISIRLFRRLYRYKRSQFNYKR